MNDPSNSRAGGRPDGKNGTAFAKGGVLVLKMRRNGRVLQLRGHAPLDLHLEVPHLAPRPLELATRIVANLPLGSDAASERLLETLQIRNGLQPLAQAGDALSPLRQERTDAPRCDERAQNTRKLRSGLELTPPGLLHDPAKILHPPERDLLSCIQDRACLGRLGQALPHRLEIGGELGVAAGLPPAGCGCLRRQPIQESGPFETAQGRGVAGEAHRGPV